MEQAPAFGKSQLPKHCLSSDPCPPNFSASLLAAALCRESWRAGERPKDVSTPYLSSPEPPHLAPVPSVHPRHQLTMAQPFLCTALTESPASPAAGLCPPAPCLRPRLARSGPELFRSHCSIHIPLGERPPGSDSSFRAPHGLCSPHDSGFSALLLDHDPRRVRTRILCLWARCPVGALHRAGGADSL